MQMIDNLHFSYYNRWELQGRPVRAGKLKKGTYIVMSEKHISNAIRCVGVDDTTIRLFEGQYPVPNGVSYNSYLLLDEKCALFDTVDAAAGRCPGCGMWRRPWPDASRIIW